LVGFDDDAGPLSGAFQKTSRSGESCDRFPASFGILLVDDLPDIGIDIAGAGLL